MCLFIAVELSCLYKVHPVVQAPLVWRQWADLGRRIADWACSVCAALSAAALCTRRAVASDTAVPPRCAQTPEPGRCRRYLPDSSDTPRPAGGGKEKHRWEKHQTADFVLIDHQFAVIQNDYKMLLIILIMMWNNSPQIKSRKTICCGCSAVLFVPWQIWVARCWIAHFFSLNLEWGHGKPFIISFCGTPILETSANN